MFQFIPEGQFTIYAIRIFILVFLGVLFTQSSFDKIFNWKDNLDFLKSHFAKSPVKNQVPLLLFTISIFELLAGVLSFGGIVCIVFCKSLLIAKAGICFSALSLVSLFTGQRLAKDYAGAAALVGYFIVCVIGLYFLI